MKSSQISLPSYRAPVNKMVSSRSQFRSAHPDNNIRFRRIKVLKISRTSSIPQQLSKSDSQWAYHRTTSDAQSSSDTKLYRTLSTPSPRYTKWTDLSNIQSIHDKNNSKSHRTFLNKSALMIQLTNLGNTQVCSFRDIKSVQLNFILF